MLFVSIFAFHLWLVRAMFIGFIVIICTAKIVSFDFGLSANKEKQSELYVHSSELMLMFRLHVRQIKIGSKYIRSNRPAPSHDTFRWRAGK